MNILIIGGFGFLGLQLLDDLQDALPGADIYISSSRKEVANDKVVFVDYGSSESVKTLFRLSCPDYIIHLASYCIRDLADSCLNKGQLRDDNILKALSSFKLNLKLIFVSSMAVFSMSDKQISPMRYDPESNYGLEKLYMINKLIKFTEENKQISYKIVYPSSIYGKGQTGKMFLPRLLDNIQKGTLMTAFGGNKKRDFIHVKDVSRALVQLVLDFEKHPDKHIFLHSFILYKIAQIADLVCGSLGLDPKEVIRFEDSKEDVKQDIMKFQIVAEKYSSRDEFPVKVAILEGLQEMFDESCIH